MHISKSALQRMEMGETAMWAVYITQLSKVLETNFSTIMS
ncbi:hypothetical protein [Candidatus Brachybacter algidus]